MPQIPRLGAFLLGVSVALLLLSSCGGSGGGETTANTVANTTASHENGDQTRLGIQSFYIHGSSNAIPKAGHESSAAQREAASSVLLENAEARAHHDYATQCATFGKAEIKNIIASATSTGGAKSCAKALEAQAKTAPSYVFLNPMRGPIDVLRVGTKHRAYALFHGAHGNKFYVRMREEGGAWKVEDLLPTNLIETRSSRASS